MINNKEQLRIEKAIKQSDTIIFDEEISDKDYPEIKWSIYGLSNSNEIAVKVYVGALSFYIAEKSQLISPPMNDRMFGLDVSDQQLAAQLSNNLWEKHQKELLAEL